jgi:dCMP deaminase
MERANWDEYFMIMAKVIATRSKDQSTKVGAVIVGPDHEIRSTGYNGMARGVNDDVAYRHQRPEKYKWFEHAERNAIYNAARMGAHLLNCKIYGTQIPCTDCSRAIIQAGLREVIVESLTVNERWIEDALRSQDMFHESGVLIREIGIVKPGGYL